MPTNGDTRNLHGLDWTYVDPPGVWVPDAPPEPLQKPTFDLRGDLRAQDDD